MAIAAEPKLLIADEPTTALDVTIQAQIMELLLDLQREQNMGLVLITHDLAVVSGTCEELNVMYAGRIVEHGATSVLLDAPRHPYTAALGASFPRVGDPAARYAPAGLAGDPPDPRELPPGCSFHPRCPIGVDECTTGEPVLELKRPERAAACIKVPEVGR